MKLRFLCSMIVAALIFVLTVFVSGGNPLFYIDLPTFLIVGIAPLVYQLASFGFAKFGNAFSSPLKKNSSMAEITQALAFFKTYNKSTWAFTLMAVGVSFIEILTNLMEPEKLGPNMAVAILSVLYAALINLLLILPYTAVSKQRLAETDFEM